jgi:hypothetical protein
MGDGRLRFDSLDACLGPGSARFFGSGYKRVGQALCDLECHGSMAPGAGVRALGSLSYPPDWSRKAAGRELRPHLSSIDALVLAVSLAEAHLAAAGRLDEDQLRRAWLCRVQVRAGARPHEQLDGFPVTARLLRSWPNGRADTPVSSEYDCRIGALRVRCTLAHEPAERPATRPARYPTLDDVLGPAAGRLYGDGYKAHQLQAAEVRVELAEQLVRARQSVSPGPAQPEVSRGAEAAYAPSVSVIDGIVGIAQLAQALLYALDAVPRERSNTLWMRRFVVAADTPSRPCDKPFATAAAVTRNRVVALGGDSWRAIELRTDDFARMRGSCSLAHRLPGKSGDEYLEYLRRGE